MFCCADWRSVVQNASVVQSRRGESWGKLPACPFSEKLSSDLSAPPAAADLTAPLSDIAGKRAKLRSESQVALALAARLLQEL